MSSKKIFTKGFISNTLNPKVALFFMAFLPQFIICSEGVNTSLPFIFLGLIFAGCTFLFLSVLGFFSGYVGQYLMKNKRITKGVQNFSGIILILPGIRLALIKQKQ